MGGRLEGKVAVVTGAANGIGKATAARFAAEGAALVLGDIEADSLEAFADALRQDGADARAVVGDLTRESDAEWLIGEAVSGHGRVDVLVNNLGGAKLGKLWEMELETWEAVLALNLRSLFLCTKHAAKAMIERRQGAIVCLSSGAREGTPWSAYYGGNAPYSTAKAGVHGFVRNAAYELSQHGVRINAVGPGPIDTERVGQGLRDMNETVEFSPNKMTPMGRLGTPEEVANAILFLASDEASYITGHTLSVAGGR